MCTCIVSMETISVVFIYEHSIESDLPKISKNNFIAWKSSLQIQKLNPAKHKKLPNRKFPQKFSAAQYIFKQNSCCTKAEPTWCYICTEHFVYNILLYLDKAWMCRPSVYHTPFHARVFSFLLVMSVDCIQTATSCGTWILRILRECYCSFYSITEFNKQQQFHNTLHLADTDLHVYIQSGASN